MFIVTVSVIHFLCFSANHNSARCHLYTLPPPSVHSVTQSSGTLVHCDADRFFELEVRGRDAAGRPVVGRTELGNNATYRLIYTDVLYYVLCFALPLVSLAFMNWRVIIGYRAAQRRRHRIVTSAPINNTSNATLLDVCVAIVCLSLFLTIPVRLYVSKMTLTL